MFDSLWTRYHSKIDMQRKYPLSIINDIIFFNLDIEYERHSTHELSDDQFRSLRFVEGGDEIAINKYYVEQIPIKRLNGIQFKLNDAEYRLNEEDIILKIKTKSITFSTRIDYISYINDDGNNTLQIDELMVSGKIQEKYNSIITGDEADIQLFDIKHGMFISEVKRIIFKWLHYEIKTFIDSSYYYIPGHKSQKIEIRVECFGREFRQISLSLKSVNSLNRYILKLIRIIEDDGYIFETEEEILSGEYEFTILSKHGQELSNPKKWVINNDSHKMSLNVS